MKHQKKIQKKKLIRLMIWRFRLKDFDISFIKEFIKKMKYFGLILSAENTFDRKN